MENGNVFSQKLLWATIACTRNIGLLDWQKREKVLSQCSIAMQFFGWMVIVLPILLIPRSLTNPEK
jgi:hypothetical protein